MARCVPGVGRLSLVDGVPQQLRDGLTGELAELPAANPPWRLAFDGESQGYLVSTPARVMWCLEVLNQSAIIDLASGAVIVEYRSTWSELRRLGCRDTRKNAQPKY